jgi:serine protease AprX
MVTGAVALLLQDEPDLTPDQVKFRLVNASSSVDGQPYLDVYAAVTGDTTGSLNTGLEASQLLWSGDEPVEWDSVNWNSVNWNSVNWNSVNWNSVNWNSVNWNSVSWDD